MVFIVLYGWYWVSWKEKPVCIGSGWTTTTSLFTFYFLGHVDFPSICYSMRKKAQFHMVLIVCFILSTISYVSMAVLGYIIFRDELLSQVTLHMPKENVSSKIVVITTLALLITKCGVIVNPIAIMVEMTALFQVMWMRRYIFHTCLVFSTIVVTIVVLFFRYVMTLIGAFVGITLSILCPCIYYSKIILRTWSFGVEWAVIFFIVLD